MEIARGATPAPRRADVGLPERPGLAGVVNVTGYQDGDGGGGGGVTVDAMGRAGGGGYDYFGAVAAAGPSEEPKRRIPVEIAFGYRYGTGEEAVRHASVPAAAGT